MKKPLLLLLAAGVWCGSQAQNSTAVKSNHVTVNPAAAAVARYKASLVAEKNSPARNTKGNHKIGNEPILPPMGSSANVNTSRYTASTQLTANQACNLLVMTHRIDYSKVGTCGTGAYEVAKSTDAGATWDTSITMNCNNPTRYPNGALFNPAGNTSPANVYDAYMGAWNDGSTTTISWTATDYGSVQISGANLHTMYWQNTGGPGYNQNGGQTIGYVSSSDDSTVHGLGEGWTSPANNYVTWTGAVLTTGKFDPVADSFKWTQTVFRPHLVPAIKGFATNSFPFDSMAYPLGQPGTAWSQDGKTGYVVIFGNLDSAGYNYTSYQPIVYRTGDAGATWAMMPMFNFRNCPNLTTYLYPTSDSNIKTPLWDLYTYYGGGGFSDYDLTVDNSGNLHIIGTIISQFYSNPDSAYDLSWYRNQHGYIYDVYNTNPTGGWNSRFIDSMTTYSTNVVTASESTDWDNTTGGYISMTNRLQASRSTDGKLIFAIWEDDMTGVVTDSLVAPDVKGEAFNASTGKIGPVISFTNTNNNYFLSVSDIAISSGGPNKTWTIPCSIAYPETTPDDGTTAVNHFYLGTIQFNDSLNSVSAVPTVTKNGFSISPNYPNPFSNVTNFNVSLTNESTVSVDVYSMVGQKVYSIAAQKMSSGNHIMTINANGWNAGVYFYRVTANGESITQKMMVK